MKIKTDPDWWKSMFDDVYLLTDSRSVCDEELTRREVDVICRLLTIHPGHRVLDLCGGHGRHSLEFCARGFAGFTLLDYSRCLIEHAKASAHELNYSVDFLTSDARNTGLSAESFDHVLILGNSLGYIEEASADGQILAEANRVLCSGGSILVDVTDGAAIETSYSPNVWHEIDSNIVVCRQREIRGNRVCAREIVLSKQKGLIRDRNYSIRLYKSDVLATLLEQAGFVKIQIHDFSPQLFEGDCGFMNHRIFATGQKKSQSEI